MAEKKIIVVLGATGAQGGGVARAILNDNNSEFTVRAVTRDVTSAAAKALAAQGADVVAANIDDVDSMRSAFSGAYGAYCVTFYWSHLSPEREIAEAKTMAEVAKSAGIRHAIWSTLEDTRKWIPLSDDRMPTLMGHYKVPHFDAKGASDHFFTDLGVPTTFLLASFYWENLFGSGPKPDPDGVLNLAMPMADKKLAGIAAEDIGKSAYGIFKQGTGLVGQAIGVAGEQLTGAQMAAAMATAFGREVRYTAIPPAVFRGFGFPGADDLGNMFQFYSEFEQVCCDARSVERTRALNPELQAFDQWLDRNKDRIPR